MADFPTMLVDFSEVANGIANCSWNKMMLTKKKVGKSTPIFCWKSTPIFLEATNDYEVVNGKWMGERLVHYFRIKLPHHHFTIWMIVWGADRYGGTSASVTVCNQINLWGIGNAVQVEKHDQDKIYSNTIVIIMSYLCQYSIQISVRLYYGWYFLPPFLTRCQLTPTETVLNSDVFQFLSWWYGHVSKWETPQRRW